ncbi:hypothetical protein [Flavobacterium sp. UBA7682]|uniref:hypothetical protein n=1 Tax=Flavobacterium sp. UBA7682 TaxID=1946560 RepID=UPI0025BD0127|nr:hypothetical protein [Flavobacterium sp. UBA7682]
MGYFWSMGISFKNKELAEQCETEIDSLILSDNTFVGLKKYVEQNEKLQTYILGIYPEGMEIAESEKLFSYPFFQEIRNQLNNIVLNLEIEYNIAFYEFEAADYLLNEDIVEDISNYGLGEIRERDFNVLYFDEEHYIPKRYFDGLILSNDEYKKIAMAYPEFEPYKKGYVWLPNRNSR